MYDITQLTFSTNLIAYALTYLLHSTAWILLTLFLVKSPIFNTPLLKNYLWKGALIGGLLTSILIHFSGNSLLEIHLAQEKNMAIDTKQATVDKVPNAEIAEEVYYVTSESANNSIGEVAQLETAQPIKEVTAIKNTTPKTFEAQAIPSVRTAQPIIANNFEIVSFLLPIFFILWLVGSLFFTLKETIRHFIFIKKVGKRSTTNHPAVIYALNKIRLKLKQKLPIILSQSPVLESPILIKNKEICLPEKAINKLDNSQMEAMLAHEVAHVMRKDYYWNCFLLLIDTLFFFQPLHRLAIKEIQTTNELLCDEWAAKVIGNNLALAQCLLTVATWMKSPTKTYPLVAGMSLKKSELSDRITSLINLPDMKKQRFNTLKVGLPFIALLATALLILPGFTFTSLTETVPTLEQVTITDSDRTITDDIMPIEQPSKEPSNQLEVAPIEQQQTEQSTKKRPANEDLALNRKLEKLSPTQVELNIPSHTAQPISPAIPQFLDKPTVAKETASVTPTIRLEEKFAVNKNHPYFELFQKTEQKAAIESDWKLDIKAIYYTNLSCAGTSRSKLGGPIVSNKGDKNSLIFTLDYGDRVEYDTLQNCVHPPRNNDGYAYKVGGGLANWIGKQIYKATDNNIQGGHPAVVKSQWVQQSDNQKQTPMGLELLGKATVKIEIFTTKGKHITTVADGVFEAGKHEFIFPHVNIKKGTYRLVSTVNGKTLSQNIRVKRTRFTHKKEKNNCAALLRAVKGNKVEQVKALVQSLSPNCEYRAEGEPRSPLNAAARKGNVEIGKILLAANADVEFRAGGDEGALMGAARYGHLDFVKLMVENGADVNKTVNGDGTALINAVRSGHYEIAEYLLQKGADPMLGVSGDENPITHAIDQGNDMLDLLLKYRKSK